VAMSTTARFWAKTRIAVDCECSLCARTDDAAAKCIMWTASYTGSGYGGFWNGERLVRAHRAAYQMANGHIPVGMHLDHLCRVRMCVAPAHLEPVTPKENVQRGLRGVLSGTVPRNPGPRSDPPTHCPHGHELTPENTYVSPATPRYPDGRRRCRTCKNEGKRRSRARLRAQATA